MRRPLCSPELTLRAGGGERGSRAEKGWRYLEVAAFVEGVGGSEDGHLPVVEVGLIHQGDPEALHRFLLQGFQLEHQGFLRAGHLLLGHRGGGGGGRAGPRPQSSRTGRAGPGPSPPLALGPGRAPVLTRLAGPDQAPDGPRARPGSSSLTTRAGPGGGGPKGVGGIRSGPRASPPPEGASTCWGGEWRWKRRKAAEGRRW